MDSNKYPISDTSVMITEVLFEWSLEVKSSDEVSFWDLIFLRRSLTAASPFIIPSGNQYPTATRLILKKNTKMILDAGGEWIEYQE